ncbi:hypothetical protein [Deinococcus arcticus]|uniref:Uncharacterized protein n=1 Tax=Deinococcus arcticus TaxID=2136176 RepID=A0A2T3W4C2_9DEIO|nr:hypothetical protein [Deinococcus arcticus]PTA66740.1 hypothetical protein C8263_16025 [Deinococcus arcticus]
MTDLPARTTQRSRLTLVLAERLRRERERQDAASQQALHEQAQRKRQREAEERAGAVARRVAEVRGAPRAADVLWARTDPSPHVRAALAQRPDVPLAVLDHFATQRSDVVVQAVAGHPHVPALTLRKIVVGSRGLLALANPTLSRDLLLMLEERYVTAHAAVISHPSHPCQSANPAEQFEVFTRDNRAAWAHLLERQPPDLATHLQALATDRYELRLLLARVSPFETVQRKLASHHQAFDLALATNPRLADGMWTRLAARGADVQCILAEHPRLPDWLALSFAYDPVVRVRLRVAARAHLPPDVSEVLMRDSRLSVRVTLARSTTSPAVIDDLTRTSTTVREALTDRATVTQEVMGHLARHDLDLRRLYPKVIGEGPWIDIWLDRHLSPDGAALTKESARLLWALLTYAPLTPRQLHRCVASFVAWRGRHPISPWPTGALPNGYDGLRNRPQWWTAVDDGPLRLKAMFLMGLEDHLPDEERAFCQKVRFLGQRGHASVPLSVFGADFIEDTQRAIARDDAWTAGWLGCLNDEAADLVRGRMDDTWADALVTLSPWPIEQVPATIQTPLCQGHRVAAAANMETIQAILSAYTVRRDIPEEVVLAIGERDDLPDLFRWPFRDVWWFDSVDDIGRRLKARAPEALMTDMVAWGYDGQAIAQTLADLAAWPEKTP